jgi:hypothetical protein
MASVHKRRLLYRVIQSLRAPRSPDTRQPSASTQIASSRVTVYLDVSHMEIYTARFHFPRYHGATVCCLQTRSHTRPPIMSVPGVSGHANVAACACSQHRAAPPSSSLRHLPARRSEPPHHRQHQSTRLWTDHTRLAPSQPQSDTYGLPVS